MLDAVSQAAATPTHMLPHHTYATTRHNKLESAAVSWRWIAIPSRMRMYMDILDRHLLPKIRSDASFVRQRHPSPPSPPPPLSIPPTRDSGRTDRRSVERIGESLSIGGVGILGNGLERPPRRAGGSTRLSHS